MIEELYVQIGILALLALVYIRIMGISSFLKRPRTLRQIDSFFDDITFSLEHTGNPKSLAPIAISEFILEVRKEAMIDETAVKSHYLDLVSFFLDELCTRIIGESYKFETLTCTSPFVVHKKFFIENIGSIRHGIWNKDEEKILEGLSNIVTVSVVGEIVERKAKDPRLQMLRTQFTDELADLSKKLINEEKKIASLDHFIYKWSEALNSQPDPDLIFILYSLYYMSRNFTTDLVHINVETLRNTLKNLGVLLSKLNSGLSQGDRKEVFIRLLDIYRLLRPYIP